MVASSEVLTVRDLATVEAVTAPVAAATSVETPIDHAEPERSEYLKNLLAFWAAVDFSDPRWIDAVIADDFL